MGDGRVGARWFGSRFRSPTRPRSRGSAGAGMTNDGHRASRSSHHGGVERPRIVVPPLGGSGSHGPHTTEPDPEPPKGGTKEQRWVARPRSSLRGRRSILLASCCARAGETPVLRASRSARTGRTPMFRTGGVVRWIIGVLRVLGKRASCSNQTKAGGPGPLTGGTPVLRARGAPAAASWPPHASGTLIWQNMVERERKYQHKTLPQAARALRRSAASMRAMTRRVLSLRSAPKRSCTYASAASHRPGARCSLTDWPRTRMSLRLSSE